ncbi:CocE/NonD family hydrolase [Microbacterium sp. RD1]|uniref:CocE/NonD family hydrolase n=1 Tax=Microbacterium sp. RD1 TaxID=3457313 RepID=UPI003FA571FD
MRVIERGGMVLRRIRRALRPSVTITDPPDGVVAEWNVPVPMRDGTILRANVFRPASAGAYPVIVSAHPYGKDRLPHRRRGGGWTVPRQYRLLPQDEPFAHSAWTSWEAPDPAFWVPRGYVVVNADLRGWGTSGGTGELFTAQEGEDGHDLVEWAAGQSWSSGRVGMAGVSYLAIVQWRVAATRPPHLFAISPWEGFTDLYRDFAFPGGIREDGFSVLWNAMLTLARRRSAGLRRLMRRHPLIDGAWNGRDARLEDIEVPALVCASFSDQNLHTRGSFQGFLRIGSSEKRLYTHRGPKWATYYSPAALEEQAGFFDEHLRGAPARHDTGAVRLEVRSDGRTVAAVTRESSWPPADLSPHTVTADAGDAVLTERAPSRAALRRTRGGTIRFTYRFETDTDVIGPMRLRVHVSTARDDLTLFARVEKRSGDRTVGFEGSYGFTSDAVAHGWLRASHRALTGEPPQHPHDRRVPMSPGRTVLLDLELLPSATRFAAGDELVLCVTDSWPYPADPLTGAFPARYTRTRRQLWAVHTGPVTPTDLTFSERPVVS